MHSTRAEGKSFLGAEVQSTSDSTEMMNESGSLVISIANKINI